MKKTVMALTALGAFAAAPAFAGGTHLSIGFYSPAPVYYAPAPVYYAPPPPPPIVRYTPYSYTYTYYGPRPCHPHHGRGHEHAGWNAPRYGGYYY